MTARPSLVWIMSSHFQLLGLFPCRHVVYRRRNVFHFKFSMFYVNFKSIRSMSMILKWPMMIAVKLRII